jgi:glycosyltransferase involved in cell wall biosynthesis
VSGAAPEPAAIRLSAVIITRNEEANLPACLESVKGLAEEIVVLDSGSTDRTVAVAEAAGARVVRQPFAGFGAAKQRALEMARGAWVLSLDADERVTPALANEIRAVLASAASPDGFLVRREVFFVGRRLRFGGTGNDWVLRLFRRTQGRFSDAVVHERVVLHGRRGRLRATLEHHTYRTVAEHVEKMNRYTDMQAAALAERAVRYRGWMWLRLPWKLFVGLVLRFGLLDGTAGVLYATMYAYSSWLKYAKTWRGS